MRTIALVLASLPLAPHAGARAAEMTGAATPLILSLCEALPAGEDGPTHRCPGLNGVDAFVSERGGSAAVSLGTREGTERFEPTATLGKTMEWRIGADGRPFAGILRFAIGAPGAASDGTVLSIVTVGAPGRPGCRVAVIDVTVNPDASAIAERIADERAPRFRCGVDRPELVGIASDWAQRTILPALGTP